MPRKKLDNPEDILSQPIIVRVTEKVFKRLEKIQQESGCQSIGEVARMILSGEQINCFYKDVSLNAPMEEMALIRKKDELLNNDWVKQNGLDLLIQNKNPLVL